MILSVIGLIFILLQLAQKYFVINISSSRPIGLYYIEKLTPSSSKTIKRGDIVAICLMHKVERLGLQRQYIMPGTQCHKSKPLIKTIFAVPGDSLILILEKITLNGKNYSLKTLKTDSQNRALEIYPRGIYKHTVGYWVIGTYAFNSWDSRYWGPLQEEQILFQLHPVLIFEKLL